MYQIKNPWTQTVLFECELPADVAAESPAKQLGWAIKKARGRAGRGLMLFV